MYWFGVWNISYKTDLILIFNKIYFNTVRWDDAILTHYFSGIKRSPDLVVVLYVSCTNATSWDDVIWVKRLETVPKSFPLFKYFTHHIKKLNIAIFKTNTQKRTPFCPVRLKLICMERDRSVLVNKDKIFSLYYLCFATRATRDH